MKKSMHFLQKGATASAEFHRGLQPEKAQSTAQRPREPAPKCLLGQVMPPMYKSPAFQVDKVLLHGTLR